MKKNLLGLLATLSIQIGYPAPFQNLGFDAGTTSSSTIGHDPGLGLISGGGPVADLLPGWQLFAGTDRLSTIGYNSFPLDGPNHTLISQDASLNFRFPVEGSYALLFDGGSPLPSLSYSLHQQGDIPAGVKYLTILEAPGPNVNVIVTINNTLIPFLNFGNFWNPSAATQIFYDISSYAGQNVDL